MYILARNIKAMGIKVVLSGEGADEALGGYLFFHKAPSPEALHSCALSSPVSPPSLISVMNSSFLFDSSITNVRHHFPPFLQQPNEWCLAKALFAQLSMPSSRTPHGLGAGIAILRYL